MITWSCKATLMALACSALTACEGGQQGLSTTLVKPEEVALSRARMAFGQVLLVAPTGYCIDRSSLKQNFALMARCDQLGRPSAAGDAPLGLITASFSPANANAVLPTANHTAQALGLDNVSRPVVTQSSVLFQAVGSVPDQDLGPVQWRGTAQIGSQFMGLALYGPADGRATSSEGGALLSELINVSSANAGT
ncbi:MAG: hypothetical protein ABJL67_19390 [Sulfitobacter sp.]